MSVDSIHAHVAWVQNVREKLAVSIQFPMKDIEKHATMGDESVDFYLMKRDL